MVQGNGCFWKSTVNFFNYFPMSVFLIVINNGYLSQFKINIKLKNHIFLPNFLKVIKGMLCGHFKRIYHSMQIVIRLFSAIKCILLISLEYQNVFKIQKSPEINWRKLGNCFRKYRSSLRRCSIEKGVLKEFANFTGKYLCWSLFLINLKKATLT